MRSFKEILDEYTLSWEKISFANVREAPDMQIECVLSVVPPYVMNVERYVKKEHRTGKLWNQIKDTFIDLQKKIPGDDNMDPCGSIYGKGRPEILSAMLEINANAIMDSKRFKSLRDALIYYGIGIDCSGFVSRAIGKIMHEYNMPEDDCQKTLGVVDSEKENFHYRSNASILRDKGSFKLKSPMEIEVGDVIMRITSDGFHILIIIDVELKGDSVVQFITAEASSVKNILRVYRSYWHYEEWTETRDGKKNDCRALQRYDEEKSQWNPVKGWNIDEKKSEYVFARPYAFQKYFDQNRG